MGKAQRTSLPRIAFLLVGLLLVTSCSHAETSPTISPRRGIVFFIPGYYGTKLVHEKTGEVFFVTAYEALIGKRTLQLPVPGWTGPAPAPLKTAGVLEKVPILGSLWQTDVYGASLDQLRRWAKPQGVEVVPIEFDWRQGLPEILQSIYQQINQRQPQMDEFVAIIGHSMGGLLTAHILRDQPDWLDAVVMAAPALRGTPQLLRNSLIGTSQGLNKALLSNSAVSSFPSTYMMLPLAEEWQIVERRTQQQRKPDLHQAEFWQKHQWGLFQSGLQVTAASLQERLEWTARHLEAGKTLWKKLMGGPDPGGNGKTQVLLLQAIGTPTNDRAHIPSDDFSKISFFEEEDGFAGSTHVDGDGTLSTASTSPLPWMHQLGGLRVVQKKLGHLEILSDREPMRISIDFLNEAINRGLQSQKQSPPQSHRLFVQARPHPERAKN